MPLGFPEGLLMSELVLPVRKRNRLPLDEYRGNKVYSLTICTADRQPYFESANVVEACFQILTQQAEAAQADVFAFCFMPDHLHLLVGSESVDVDLLRLVKRFKEKSGWWFRTVGRGSLKASPTTSQLWQKSYYDHVVRSEEGLRTVAEYVLGNPVRAGLTSEVGQYPFAGSLVWTDLAPPALTPTLS